MTPEMTPHNDFLICVFRNLRSCRCVAGCGGTDVSALLSVKRIRFGRPSLARGPSRSFISSVRFLAKRKIPSLRGGSVGHLCKGNGLTSDVIHSRRRNESSRLLSSSRIFESSAPTALLVLHISCPFPVGPSSIPLPARSFSAYLRANDVCERALMDARFCSPPPFSIPSNRQRASAASIRSECCSDTRLGLQMRSSVLHDLPGRPKRI